MRKRIASLIGLALLTAVSASAQTTNGIRVDVPFSFAAAGTTWVPGTYKLDVSLSSGLVILHSLQSPSRTFLTQTSQTSDSGSTRVRFQRYGNQWVLRAIVGNGMEAVVLPGKLERELMSRKPSEGRTLLAHVRR